jgi:hypothetical protein
MTTSKQSRLPSQKPDKSPPRPEQPLVSLRTFVLIVASLGVAVGAMACAYYHKQWLIVGVAAFAASLAFFNRSVK